MNAFRRIFGFKEEYKHDEDAVLERFMRVEANLTIITERLESLDSRRQHYECAGLLTQLRRYQSTLLNILLYLCSQFVPEDKRPSRDYRLKFSDDVLTDLLPGQLWFGAECLASGSSIPDREVESETMRPIARQLLELIESLRSAMQGRYREVSGEREWTDQEDVEVSHDLSSMQLSDSEARLLRRPSFVDQLKKLDAVLAHFEYCYVSAVTPVKTMRQVDRLQEVLVLFADALGAGLHSGLIQQDAVDFCDPALMFSIPRLGIVRGLLIGRALTPPGRSGVSLTWGPIDPDGPSHSMCDMFVAYRRLLIKIKRLLLQLSAEQLGALQRQLCDTPSAATERVESDSDTEADADTTSGTVSCGSLNVFDGRRNSAAGSSEVQLPIATDEGDRAERRRRHAGSSSGMSSRATPSSSKSNRKLSHKVRRMLIEAADDAGSKCDTAADTANSNTQHKLFVCISGIADILQTTHASDMRYVLRTVFAMYVAIEAAAPPPPLAVDCAPAPVGVTRDSTTITTAPNGTPRAEVEVAHDALEYTWTGRRARSISAQPAPSVASSRRAPPPPTVPVVVYHTARPVWVPDERVRVCLICAAPFSLIRRRHHCRNCGNIFCSTCSSKRLVLKSAKRLTATKRASVNARRTEAGGETEDSSAVRVCDRCFHTLTTTETFSSSSDAELLRSRLS